MNYTPPPRLFCQDKFLIILKNFFPAKSLLSLKKRLHNFKFSSYNETNYLLLEDWNDYFNIKLR